MECYEFRYLDQIQNLISILSSTHFAITICHSQLVKCEKSYPESKCTVVESDKTREEPDSIVSNVLSLIFSKGKTFWSVSFPITRNDEVNHTPSLN